MIHQNRISEGQTAVFAYPSEFSGGKGNKTFLGFKVFVYDYSENRGGDGLFSEYYFLSIRNSDSLSKKSGITSAPERL